MPGRYKRVCIGCHCVKVKGHAELKIEKSRVKTFIYDFPKLHHSSPNSFGANVHLRQHFFKTVKVIERSRDVTPRSKVEKSKGRPWSPCAPKSASSTKLVFELVRALNERKRHANFGAIQAIFLQLSWSQQGRGQRSNGAINRNKHFFRRERETSETPCKTKRIPP